MRVRILLPIFFFVFFLNSVFVYSVFAASESLLISEIQISGSEGKTDNDFVEIFNPLDREVSLSGWRLSKKTKSGKEYSLRVFPSGSVIASEGFFVWANSKDGFSSSLSAHVSSTETIAEENTILLCHGSCADAGNVSDTIGIGAGAYEYETAPASIPKGGNSLARKTDSGIMVDTGDNASDFVFNCDPSAGSLSLTVCKKETETLQNLDEQMTVRLNEVLANPSGDERQEEFIELYNFGDKDIDLRGWTLHDASKTGVFSFLDRKILSSRGFIVVKRSEFSFALNNTQELISLIAPNGSVVDIANYDLAKEDVAWAYDGSLWRMTKYLTPGTKNVFDDLPNISRIRIPETVFVGVPADFSVRSKYKVRWDFGDEHRSYKKKTRHTFTKSGKYTVQLRVSGDSEDITHTFTVKAEKFPKYTVRIVEISPNPRGKDSENEYIIVKNRSKKSVNLKGWSIATGYKKGKLVNHPIRESIILKKGEAKKITRSESLFSLGNTSSIIELRYPNRETSHQVRYKKTDGVLDDELYVKEKNQQWHWTIPETTVAVQKEVLSGDTTETSFQGSSYENSRVSVETSHDLFGGPLAISDSTQLFAEVKYKEKTNTIFQEWTDKKSVYMKMSATALNSDFKFNAIGNATFENDHIRVWNVGDGYCFTETCFNARIQNPGTEHTKYLGQKTLENIVHSFLFVSR